MKRIWVGVLVVLAAWAGYRALRTVRAYMGAAVVAEALDVDADEVRRMERAVEAALNVRRIFDAALARAHELPRDEEGRILPGQFLESVPLTPAEDRCAHGPERFLYDPKAWKHPTWMALGFDPGGPHRYRYTFISSARGFTARAVGDLDCDGVESTFERAANLDRDGEVVVGHRPFSVNKTE